MAKHVKILAVLNIVWGGLGAVGALVVMLVFGGLVGLIGVSSHQASEAQIAIPLIGLIGAFITLMLLITSIPAIIAGIGLLQFASWARILAIVVSALHLLSFPIGTALGIYGFWVLFTDETIRLFNGLGGSSGGPLKL